MTHPDAPRMMALSDEEQQWLEARLTLADEAGLLGSVEALAESFDTSRDDYLAQPEHARDDAAKLVNTYSVAFGQHLSEEFDLQWCIVERDEVAEMGLYGEVGNIVLYPMKTVERRWDDPALRPFIDLVEQTRISVRGAGGA